MKKLIFIENVDALGKIYPEILNLYTVIAVTPHIAYELEKKGVFYKTPEDYISLERLTEFGKKICYNVDSLIIKIHSFFDHPFFYYYETMNYYLFCRLFITVLSRLEILKGIIAKENPNEIYYVPNSPYKKDTNELFYFKEKSIYSELLPIVSQAYAIVLKEIYQNNDKPEQGNKIVFNRISKNVYNHVVQTKTVKDENSKTVLFIDSSHNNKSLFEETIKRAQCSVLHWDTYTQNTWDIYFSYEDMFDENSDTAEFKRTMDNLRDNLWENQKFKKLFFFSGLDLWDVFKDHINYYITEFLPKSYVIYRDFEKIVKEKKIDVVIGSFVTAKPYLYETVVRLANKHGIAALIYQHGGFIGYVNKIMYNKSEFKIPEYYFGFGQGVGDFAKKYNLQIEVYPVGSTLIEKQTADLPSRKTICELIGIDFAKKIVGYVPTAMLGKQYYTPGSVYPDHRYFSMIKRFFKLFSRYEDVQFVVKPYNTEYNKLITKYVKEQKFSNIVTVSNNIRHLHSIVDMYVLDLASTIMLETIASGKPVIYFHNQLVCPIEPEAVALLEKRVYLCEDWEKFCRDFETLIDDPKKDKKCKNNEFLAKYINPDTNVKSADRAYEALMDICRKKESEPRNRQVEKDIYLDRIVF